MKPLEILYEDDFYIIVNKPSGLLVHPYKKETNEKENVMKTLRRQTGHYLYPVHRLDRPVSGILLFALSSDAGKKIKEIWHEDNFIKKYTALARGEIKEPGEFNFSLKDEKGDKKEALTIYRSIENFQKTTLVEVQIKTGRKHQIRRHFSRRCHGLIGDSTHGKGRINQFFREQFGLRRIFLHCHEFSFIHPYLDKKIKIICDLSDDLMSVLEKLRDFEK